MKRLPTVFTREVAFMLSLPAVLWQLLFMIAPAAIIIYFSVAGTGIWPVTFYHYFEHIRFATVRIIGRSLFFAISTASTCLLLAYPLSYYLAFYVHRFRGILLFLLTLPFWVNFLVQVYSWYFLLEYKGLINMILLKFGIINEPLLLTNTLFAIYIVMVYCYLPFMVMPLYSALEKIDKRLLEASADLGATPWQTFVRVTLPLSFSGIKTGFLLVLIPAFGEFVIPSLLGGSKYMFVGSLVSYYFIVARDNAAGAAFTCLSALALFLAIVFLYLIRRCWVLLIYRRENT
jgi:spermidine/putrescine transport system permease protein